MLKEDIQNKIIEELRNEERVETDMIRLYQTLIENGAVNCFPEEKQEEFKRGVEILNRESEKHQRIVFNMIEKYKQG